ncbi:uncharacterized protein MYCFIDRAFT_81186 [Pseudocercospora fijiensis CIRAD86]|uniref:Uncharacterized protein n=1 Tax=Pseudocercospora fijiensis (strain CIRAD86) TaxID=383855 RepID=M2YPP5_PSEFD|nr:uncharacterized protein MYCFIDRAFT_81186 [Pseudocercospora fijiensis CIRAD86]EME79705.1 hypothetical protein MYCFIDRAFT_81186 [Pseudocercospora fijiensis CIRAD86]
MSYEYTDNPTLPYELKLMIAPSLVPGILRDVERSWLREMAMDYREFNHFCRRSDDEQYRWRTKLVIELFPSADFSNPPEQLSNANLVRQPLTMAEKRILAHRDQWSSSGHRPQDPKQLDRQIFQGLTEIWLDLIRTSGLPHFVRHVCVIAKDNDRPSPAFRARGVDGRALGNITSALKHLVGAHNVVTVF